eukprot:GHVT01021842.1.p1 GENE.GHVT01021842.1~~GHVT01021842.1.p1  ORF type:complete len:333 (+),score=1.89 GHVT01021842.1:272-1270(+)
MGTISVERLATFSAGLVNSQVKINCSVKDFKTQNNILEWRTPGDDRIFNTLWGGSPMDGYLVDYVTDEVSHITQFDLIIIKLLPNMTGQYIFRITDHVSDVDYHVNTVAMEKVSCQPSPGVLEVVEGEDVTLSCKAGFYGEFVPDIEWKHGDTWATIPANNLIVANQAIYTVNLTADGRHDETKAHCHLTFPFVEDNKSYNDTCTTYIKVIHPPRDIQFTPDVPAGSEILYVGDTVNCTARGRPEPDVYWQTVSGTMHEYSPTLRVSGPMAGKENEFVCVARATYHGEEHKITKTVKFYAEYQQVGGATNLFAKWTIFATTSIVFFILNWNC